MQHTIKHYYNQQEYVTRQQIVSLYSIPSTCLQRRLAKAQLSKIIEGTRFYFLRDEVDNLLKNKN